MYSTNISISLRMHLCNLQQWKQNHSSKPSSCTKIWKWIRKLWLESKWEGSAYYISMLGFNLERDAKTATLTLSGISNKPSENSRAVSPNTCLRRTPYKNIQKDIQQKHDLCFVDLSLIPTTCAFPRKMLPDKYQFYSVFGPAVANHFHLGVVKFLWNWDLWVSMCFFWKDQPLRHQQKWILNVWK